MKKHSRRSAALLLTCLSTLGALACARGSQNAPASQSTPAEAAPRVAASSVVVGADDKAASASADAAEPARAGALAPAAPGRESAPQGALAPKKKDAALRDEESAEMRSDVDQLSLEARYFDDSLSPNQLSCAGAKPHRDAICSIAERLCELSSGGPSTTGPGARCLEAKQSCESARSRFKARCGD